MAEAEAILKKEFSALDELSSADFVSSSPDEEIDRSNGNLKELIRTGVIDNTSFTREIEAVLSYNKTFVITGRETIVPSDASPQEGQTVRRRYTNIWMKRNGKWLLTVRHANIICKMKSGRRAILKTRRRR